MIILKNDSVYIYEIETQICIQKVCTLANDLAMYDMTGE